MHLKLRGHRVLASVSLLILIVIVELARCIVNGIKAARLGLAKYLVTDEPRFDPNHPDPIDSFKVPASLADDESKAIGQLRKMIPGQKLGLT